MKTPVFSPEIMNIYEIDWRIGPLEGVVVAIDRGLAALRERVDDNEVDGIDALEMADSLLGLGFVAAQTYALGSSADLKKLRSSTGKSEMAPWECYRADLLLPETDVTRIQLINAGANYFKHHDEWSGWSDKRGKETINILARVGITEDSEFPCVDVTELLCGKRWEFVVIHQIVREWRTKLFVDFC